MAGGKIQVFDGQANSDPFTPQLYNGGAPGGANFDTIKSLQGKGTNSVGISSGGGVGSTSITFSSAPVGLQPGAWLFLGGGGISEVVLTSQSYTAGANPVPIQTAVQNAGHTNGTWSMFAVFGPGLGGILPDDIQPVAPTIWDQVNFQHYLLRSATADGVVGQNVPLQAPGLWNGASADRQRGNVDQVVIASATYTSNQNSADQTNYNGRGLLLYVTTGAQGLGAANILATLQGRDPTSGNYYTILTSAAFPANSFIVHHCYPGLVAIANVTVNDVLPRTWRVQLTATQWGTGGSVIGVTASVIV